MDRRATLQLLAFLAVVVGGRRALSAEAKPFLVIVNPENPSSAAARQMLADAFLKKTAEWADGQGIRPVDLKADSTVRARFSEAVLGRSVAAVKHYWQQIIFSGRGVPPPEVATDADVIDYVLRHRGGVGYVSPRAALRGAKVLEVRE